jgi:DNA polymerase III delta subunit
MLDFNKEYFDNQYYFLLKNKGDKFSLHYSVGKTIKESKEQDYEIEFLMEDLDKIKNFIKKLTKSGIKFTKDQLKKIFNKFKETKKEVKTNGEIDEFVGADGSFLGSNIPMLNQRMVTKNTTDQTVRQTRANQFPYIRVYYGESKEEDEDLLNEINMKKAFAYGETKNARSYKDASKILKKMGVEDPFERHERLEKMGFDPVYDKELKKQKRVGHCKNCFSKRRLSELEKNKMQKMLDEILLSKKKKTSDVINDKDESESVVSKILMRNIEAIKRLADKEGVSVDKLVKKLKTGE